MNTPNADDEQKVRVHSGTTGRIMMANDREDKIPRERPDPEDYSGLQVVETGPEVVDSSHLPEVAEIEYNKQQAPPQVVPHHQLQHQQQQQQQQQQQHYHPGAYPEPTSAVSSSVPTSSPYSGSTVTDHQYKGGHNPYLSEKGARDGRICGLRRKVFLIVLAVVGLGIVTALAVGLGVGLGLRTKSSSPNSLPAPTATATADSGTDIVCPSANRTLYTLAESAANRTFLVLCGRDYNSNGGAMDISQVNITTFEGCLAECGNTVDCTAVGWGNYYGTNTCWLKSVIGSPNWSGNWYAAVEDNTG